MAKQGAHYYDESAHKFYIKLVWYDRNRNGQRGCMFETVLLPHGCTKQREKSFKEKLYHYTKKYKVCGTNIRGLRELLYQSDTWHVACHMACHLKTNL